MKMIVIAAVCAVAAVAAGAFAWQRQEAFGEARREAARVNAELQKARSDLRAVSAQVDALRKEVAEQKMALEQAQADLATARSFVEAEKAVAARLREELAQAKQALASTGSRRAQPAPSFAPPMAVQPRPTTIRAAPGGQAVGAPSAAR